jgi:hypothetical protein
MRLRTVSKPVLLAAVILLAGVAATAIVEAGNSAPALSSGENGPSPALITPSTAWDGVNYSRSCSGCLPADAQVASGSGYVLEMVNASYEIWTTAGTLLTSNSLSTFFGANSHDVLADPQLRFDSTLLRWFATCDDLTRGQIWYGSSESSDPTGAWNIQHFNVAGNEVPERSSLGVDTLNLVVGTNLYSGLSGAFQGAQVWVANMTQLLGGGSGTPWSSPVYPAEEALVPADALTTSKTMYLVTDGTGGTTTFDLLTLTGSPGGTPAPSLSSPVTFSSSTTSPPNATQAGSSRLVSVGDGRIESAVWRAGTLWADATGGCTPSGDTVLRSCLHLWKLNTTTSTMSQNFVWSSGAGTYDFDPALSTNPSGDLTVVFGESSATLDPSVMVTGQTSADAVDSLEPALLLKAGTGPDAPGSSCAGNVCPFGAYFGAAFEPFSGDRFWVAGEYTGSDSSTNYWRTWVASVDDVPTYSVNFSESGLVLGSTWSVTLNGITSTSDASLIVFLEPRGAYTYSVQTPLPGTPGTRYAAAPAGGSFVLSNGNVTESITFTKQYRLTTSVRPSIAGMVDPNSSWFNASSAVSLGALANSTFAFRSWAGNGSGSYNGTSNPTEVVMSGPITEQATFVNSTTYRLTFASSGLPSGTSWTVALNGLERSSGAANVTFNVTNGSYTYAVETPITGAPGVEYTVSPDGGSFSVDGVNLTVPAAFITEYRLTTNFVTAGSGSVSPPTGWFAAGTRVNVSAVPATGDAFTSWMGSGPGSYTGRNDPAAVTMEGPVIETANFTSISHPTFPVLFGILPGGSGNITFNGQSYSSGQSVAVPAGVYSISQVPSTGWEFGQWTVGGGVALGPGTANVTGAGWVNATYAAVHLVSIVTAPTSCGVVSVAGNVYGDGASVALVNGTYPIAASACGNYSVVSLVGTGGAQVGGKQLQVTGSGSVVATFAQHPSTDTSSTGIDAPIPLWALLLAIGLAGVALVLFLLLVRGRRKPPRESVPKGAVVGMTPVSVASSTPSVPPDTPPAWRED